MALSHLFVCAIVGLVAHHGFFIHGEWHLRLHTLLFVHLVLVALCVLAAAQVTFTIRETMNLTLLMNSTYFFSLFSSMTTYRIFFHRLRKFPGPRMAAVTKFWHIFQARHSTNYLVMKEMNEKYGPFVRTGPTEITIFHPNAIEEFDNIKFKTIKDEFCDLIHPLTSTVFIREPVEHKERRAIWSLGISSKALDVYSDRLAQLVQRLSECIKDLGNEGEHPVNVLDVMSWFAFDAMGEVLFGEDFGMIKARQYHPAVVRQKRALAMMGPILNTMWVPRMAFTFTPFLGNVKDWMNMVAFCDERMARRMRNDCSNKSDLAALFIKEYHEQEAFKSRQDRHNLLSGSTLSAVIAGSDTSRSSFIATVWYLCKFPEHAEKIYGELQSLDNSLDANGLATLPHLNGVINEILRLLPPVLTGNGRVTGPDGMMIDGTWIPAYTKINAPKYVIQRLPSAFQQPDEFIPERWYSRPELILNRAAFRPFGVGNRGCVGKALAYIELRLVVSMVVDQYEVKFAPGYDDNELYGGLREHVTAQPGKVLCLFVPRR